MTRNHAIFGGEITIAPTLGSIVIKAISPNSWHLVVYFSLLSFLQVLFSIGGAVLFFHQLLLKITFPRTSGI